MSPFFKILLAGALLISACNRREDITDPDLTGTKIEITTDRQIFT